MKIIKYSVIGFLSAFTILSSCKHNNIESVLGPSYCSEIIETVKQNRSGTADFTKEADTITAKISGNSNWKITIKGKTSNAFKTYVGVSNDIKVLWYGESEIPEQFVAGEVCDVTLISNCQDPITNSITISSIGKYNNLGYLVDDLESTTKVSSNASRSVNFGKTNASVVFLLNYAKNVADSTIKTLQGEGFIRFSAIPKNYYVGELVYDVFSTLNPKRDLVTSLGGSSDISLENVYLNFLGNCKSNKGNKLTIKILETSNASNWRQLDVTILNTGKWNGYSVKLSDIPGMKDVKNVDKIKFEPGPIDGPTDWIDISLDLITITKDKPLYN